MKLKKIVLLILITFTFKILAQDIRGAFIRTEWVPTFTYTYQYKITVNLLVDATKNIQRPFISVSFGDATTGTLSLSSSTTAGGFILKTYSGTHTYAGSVTPPSYYQVTYIDSFRVAGIKNIQNSQTQQISALAKIYANQISWTNTSVAVTNFPPSLTVSGNSVLYNPSVTSSVVGDSLSFSLVNCYANTYYKPNGVTINSVTGEISFSKDSIGLYAFCIKISEFQKNTSNIYDIAGVTLLDFVIEITTSLGVGKNRFENENVSLYPNPNNGAFEVRMSEFRPNIYHYQIYDLTGKVIESGNKNITKKDIQFNLSNSNYKSGVYLLKLDSSEKSYMCKFIIE